MSSGIHYNANFSESAFRGYDRQTIQTEMALIKNPEKEFLIRSVSANTRATYKVALR